jgi:hypothetical protein
MLAMEAMPVHVSMRDGKPNVQAAVLVIATVVVFSILSVQARGAGITRPPLRGSIVAVVLSSVLCAAFTHALAHYPPLGRYFYNWDLLLQRPWQPTHVAGIAAFVSLIQVGIYSVAFVVPAGLERERIRALEIENLRLEAHELRTRAELARLRSQLEPHFLLNTLNLVSGLVTIDPQKARSVLGNLGDLLRDALAEHGELQTLEAEVAWLRRYTAILSSRHGEELLTFEWQVADAASPALLPRLLLQPLIENAVQHGALRCRGGGRVVISAERTTTAAGPRLRCTIRNDRPKEVGGVAREGAIGIENVKRRLAVNCPGATFELRLEDEACVASIDLPFDDALSVLPRAKEAS